jgi:rsbT antagonist protein RsbS
VSIPILKDRDVLIASMQPSLSDGELIELQDALAESIGRLKTRGVVLDVSALDVLDSFATRTVRNIVYTAKLRGAVAVVVGIQPDVAIAMVQLGLTLEGIPTALDLEEGMELVRKRDRGPERGRHVR